MHFILCIQKYYLRRCPQDLPDCQSGAWNKTMVVNLCWVSGSFTIKVMMVTMMMMMVIIAPVIITIKLTRIRLPWKSGLQSWFCNITAEWIWQAIFNLPEFRILFNKDQFNRAFQRIIWIYYVYTEVYRIPNYSVLLRPFTVSVTNKSA